MRERQRPSEREAEVRRWRNRRKGFVATQTRSRWTEGRRGNRQWREGDAGYGRTRGSQERFRSWSGTNLRREDPKRKEEVHRRFPSSDRNLVGEEGWQVVQRRRRGGEHQGFQKTLKADIAIASKVDNGDGSLSSFFITNFPNHYQAKDLLAVFKTFGKAQEVVIPPRRDKYGRRFGFVRFLAVKEPRHLAVKLDNIFL